MSDRPFLVEIARLACTLSDQPLPAPDDPDVLDTLPRLTDEALIASDDDGRAVGAAWWHFHEPPLWRDEQGQPIPELVIAVEDQARGHGIGTELINALAQLASMRYGALTLSVHLLNPAVRLYVRTGFRVAGAGRG